MDGTGIITFLSDSGWGGGYVAVCEAMVARIRPQARIFHISHEIPVGDVGAASLVLGRIAPLYPPAVHVAIVGPGVQQGRRPLALSTSRGDHLVGPDNGVLLSAAEALGGLRGAWLLDPARVRAAAGLPGDNVSCPFHGRDVFAPAAALLASTADPSPFAGPMDTSSLVRLIPPLAEATPTSSVSEVIEVDRFGNVGLALRFCDLPPQLEHVHVEVVGEELPEWTARVVGNYGELQPGELGIFCDSWGQVALALNSASAAQVLLVERGMRVRLSPTEQPPANSPGVRT